MFVSPPVHLAQLPPISRKCGEAPFESCAESEVSEPCFCSFRFSFLFLFLPSLPDMLRY